METVTVHIPIHRATAIIEEAGWKVSSKFSEQLGRCVYQYIRPGKKALQDGGKFGDDFLWHLDEALTRVLTGEEHE
jgi:hypothetical protein